ncbi:aminotransferase class I/II-fold pyridoxal phosphate-dependent enzyme [Vibrio sp. CAIM 722]|uniref:Aminotransferase class I/II-fold pyridoxal phosphate-dependent enzyme n=1 Tax=Vibrio eleionomae TaxID=2653505 RepID=A0A7X4LJZ6_9VIBR|nr:aminotransferase class I/II-fold pyridoxal phosphate-dependent enzyme [Vibrio eleionomae]
MSKYAHLAHIVLLRIKTRRIEGLILKNDHLIHIQFSPDRSLQEQIREHLLEKIHQGIFADKALPSCRKLAQMLNVSRNTIVLVYERLVDEGFLVSHQRSGFFANPEIDALQVPLIKLATCVHQNAHNAPDWGKKFKCDFKGQRSRIKLENWQDFPYPFIYGQPDESLFPASHWRECGRLAQRTNVIKDWLADHVDDDDPMLIKQLQTNVLSKRGIIAESDEILLTIGTQNSLFILAQLLTDAQSTVGIEDPGYPDARHIFSTFHAKVQGLRIDHEGIALTPELTGCDYVYATPSHQVPTNVTMSLKRREELLAYADKHDFVVIEDDYDSEININQKPHPSLKSLDKNGRVIYVGSLSKSLSPGLRIGFMVADRQLIKQARQLRRLMFRHPPSNNQRTCALFISLGYFDTYLGKIKRAYCEKWQCLRQALETHLPECITSDTLGGSAFWLRLPEGVSSKQVAKLAREQGVIAEDGDVLFMNPEKLTHHYMRLGFGSIKAENIDVGIQILSQIIRQQAKENETFWLS